MVAPVIFPQRWSPGGGGGRWVGGDWGEILGRVLGHGSQLTNSAYFIKIRRNSVDSG
jgi:hypothetical protein